ncbi:hypothetical protein [Sideroxydans sp. CL21]|nr:hypothetical protein [Sideroxydans sp. CL21]
MQWLVRMSALLAGLTVFASEGWADTLQQNFSGHASEEYVTNPLLNPALQGLSAWRSTVNPNYMLTNVSGADQLKAGIDLLLIHSSNTSIIADGGFPTATLGWNRQGDKSKFDVTTSYNVASTMTAMPSTTGLVSANSTSTTRNLSAVWNRELSERTTLTLNGAYTYTNFSGGGNNIGLTDFVVQTSGVKINYVLNEHSATFLNFSYVDYVPTGGGPNSRIYNSLLGLIWSASERLDWTLQAGPSRLENSSSVAGNTTTATTSLQGGMTMNYKGQLSNLVLNANRQSTPSGLGSIILTEQVSGSLSYDLSERSKTGLDLGWSKYDELTVSFFRTASVWLHHDLSTSWGLKAYINHNTSVWGGLNPAKSNMIGLSIAYTNF